MCDLSEKEKGDRGAMVQQVVVNKYDRCVAG